MDFTFLMCLFSFPLCSNLQQQDLGHLHMAQNIFTLVATEIYKCFNHKEHESNSLWECARTYVCACMCAFKDGGWCTNTQKQKLLEFSEHSVSAFIVHLVACHSPSVTFWSEQLLVFIYFWVSGVGPERCCSANIFMPEGNATTGGVACTHGCIKGVLRGAWWYFYLALTINVPIDVTHAWNYTPRSVTQMTDSFPK